MASEARARGAAASEARAQGAAAASEARAQGAAAEVQQLFPALAWLPTWLLLLIFLYVLPPPAPGLGAAGASAGAGAPLHGEGGAPQQGVDHAAMLGLSRGVPLTEAAINTAFRKAALMCHPDKHPDDPSAAARFRQVKASQEALPAHSLTTP
jgi:hypothetical protein